MSFVSADLIAQEETWDPQVLCGSILPILRLKSEQVTSIRGANVIEGLRSDDGDFDDGPMYRISNVGELEFRTGLHQSPPASTGDQCVIPGDVVVTKVAPIRAALVTSYLPRHPIDANCCLVRGLELPLALWLTLCLNQPAFGDYLPRKSGAAIVSRIRADVLRELPLPLPPPAIAGLSERVYDCMDRRLDCQNQLARLLNIIRTEIADRTPDPSTLTRLSDQPTWFRFFASADIEDSLVPEHVEVHGYQRRLRQLAGWKPIRHLARLQSDGARLPESAASLRVLQLSDAGDDLTVTRIEPRQGLTANRRVFAAPLKLNDVLLSAFVARPRVIFVGLQPDQEIYPTDHWHRLRFQETQGAWGAVLNDPEVHQQLNRLAIGTVQQFAPAWSIQQLVLPDLPLETRRSWDSSLRKWQQRHQDLETEWVRLMSDAHRLLRETHRSCGPWTQLPEILRGEEGWS